MFLIIRDIDTLQENVDQMPTGLMLIGNKKDLEEQNEREVSTETGETFAKVRERKNFNVFCCVIFSIFVNIHHCMQSMRRVCV